MVTWYLKNYHSGSASTKSIESKNQLTVEIKYKITKKFAIFYNCQFQKF